MSQRGALVNKSKGRDEMQRLIDLGRLSASLLHEISNPLSVALVSLEEINDQKSLRNIRTSLLRVNRYVNAARLQLKDASEVKKFFLDNQIKDIKQLVVPLAKRKNVRLMIDKSPHIQLKGDPIKLQKILINLVVNAIEAYDDSDLPDPKRLVKLEVYLTSKYVSLSVVDWGEGIPLYCLPKLFDAFYTTKSSHHGMGLGLAIVKRYVEVDFRGSIKVNSKARNGSRFIVKLPLP
jgi:signal transduction histidine kinase